ncbi:hypothetical protein [Rhodococcus jostii]|uniref:Uncharacterized protein n=1 Tax=Rhodococcus jostii TaxID=132919 RepID=A0ABU4CBX7_RHOJO|nr:hypothetical protein [Rhodococcus jostii]MDV6280747.1 hypothetical protein [Rhodococcus jostii]
MSIRHPVHRRRRRSARTEELHEGRNRSRRGVRRGAGRRVHVADGAIAGEVTGKKVFAALEDFEPLFFDNMVLVLDRYFVHRIRSVTGKDGNPLNEVEIIADSLMNNDGVLRGISVLKYVSGQSVLKLEIGDRIRVSAEDFERLSAAFFAELRSRFLA